jgi:hypothetical protein
MPDDMPRKVFNSRRKRAFLSFRRKSDVVWHVVNLTLFIFSVAIIIFKVRFQPPEVQRVVERVPVPTEIASAAENALPAPEPHAPPPPAPAPVKTVPPPPLDPLADSRPLTTSADRGARVNATVTEDEGRRTLIIDYELHGGRWAQVCQEVGINLASRPRFHLTFLGQGGANTFGVKVVDAAQTSRGVVWPGATNRGAWTTLDKKLSDLAPLWGKSDMDWTRVRQTCFVVSVKKGDTAGTGRVWVKDVRFQ